MTVTRVTRTRPNDQFRVVFANVKLNGRYVPDSIAGALQLDAVLRPMPVCVRHMWANVGQWNRFVVVADSELQMEFTIAFLTQESGR